MREIELKFELSASQAERLLRSRIFGNARPSTRPMHAVYFDTPDERLRKHGMALRVRREGSKWVQCLKAGRSGDAGLHARDEWEAERPDASLDRAALRGTPLTQALRGSRAALSPVFEVEMRRTAWTLDLGGGNRVEVALDRGEARHGRKRSPICELEIESIAGDPLAVFEAAGRLLGKVDLRASRVTKAQRGYELARPVRMRPAKAVPVEIAADTAIEAAARQVVGAALAQVQANEPRAGLAGGDEYLHQLRVGLRRLRSALRIFRDAFARGEARRIRADCRWLARTTGPARDWDVFAAETLPALLEGRPTAMRRELAARAAASRERARRRVRAALDSPRYTRFVLRFARWLASPTPVDGELRAAAAAALQRQHHKAMRALRRIARMDAEERHQVRIRLKRLRYACEAMASLFGRDRSDPYVKALARLQEDLGGAADARVAMALLAKLRVRGEAAGEATARLEAAEGHSLRDLEAHVAALHAATAFWHAEAA